MRGGILDKGGWNNMLGFPCGRAIRRITVGLALALLFAAPPSGHALPFGKNKLHTRGLDWQVLETDHFEIHYYPEEAEIAREVCEIAENAYFHNARLLRFKLQEKTPLFLYRNQIDFRQTNITPSVIGTGVGGFTEAYKNRIALPAPASPNLLRQVVTHEFMHAMQFDILYGEGLRSFRVYKGYLIPEWILEGLAEYAAGDWDSYAEMTVRDAVIHNRLMPLTLMDGFSHLEDVYLAYKESQLAFQFLAEHYGEEKVAAVFKGFKNQVSLSQILRENIGIGLNEFNSHFLAWAKERYWVQASGKDTPEDYGPVLAAPAPGRLSIITGPAWSPDGRWLAYVSNEDQSFRIYIKPRAVAAAARPVSVRRFESFPTQGRLLAWSPDSRRIAFVASEEGKNFLYFLTLDSQTLERVEMPVSDIMSPVWSPDNRWIVMTGIRDGIGDLYAWNPATGEWRQLTRDRWPDESPAWSPDGSFLVYSTERNDHWQLAKVDFQAGAEPVLMTWGGFDHKSPAFDAQGKGIFYSGDSNGIFNLCWMDLDRSASLRLTDLRSGAFQPALAPDGKQLAYSSYEAGSWQINLFNLDTGNTANAAAYSIPEERFREPAALVTVASGAPAPQPARGKILSDRPYSFRFSPDLLFLLAGYDSSQGLVGGGYVTASDYLGDHQVSLITDIVPGYHSQTQLAYMNATSPVAIGFAARYLRNYYRIMNLETNTLLNEFNDEEIGGAIQLARPFSLFDRLETELGVQSLRRQGSDFVVSQRATTIRLSLIHDHTSWYDYEPANGMRHNLSLVWADRFLGGEQSYTLFQLDSQYYQTLDFMNPFLVLGGRLMAAASMGEDHPLFLFGGIGALPASVTLRGYPYGGLLGSQAAVLNLELRFPLARHVNYSLWPLDFLLLKDIQCVIFDDAGVISKNLLDISAAGIRNAVGIGFRFHTFLLGKELLTIRVDFSKKTDGSNDVITAWGIGQSF